MENLKEKTTYFVIFSLIFFGLLYIFVFVPPGATNSLLRFSDQHSNFQQSSNTVNLHITGYRDELDAVLAKASTENRTVIIAIVNKAYVEGDKSMLDIFLDGFWLGEDTRGLIDHLLVVAVDRTAYERCKFLRLHCYRLETDGADHFDGEKVYMSSDFIKMMWRRTLFLGEVLKRGYHFIFTDTDVLWLRNPFSKLSLDLKEIIDIQISVDRFNGNEWSESNPINTGFYMVKSNNKTISLFDSWYGMRNKSNGLKEQDVLNRMMHEGVFKRLGLKVKFLNTLFFSGFCQDSRDVKAVTTVHSNCCRTINAKVIDLVNVIHDWNKIKNSLASNQTFTNWGRKHVACINSWK